MRRRDNKAVSYETYKGVEVGKEEESARRRWLSKSHSTHAQQPIAVADSKDLSRGLTGKNVEEEGLDRASMYQFRNPKSENGVLSTNS